MPGLYSTGIREPELDCGGQTVAWGFMILGLVCRQNASVEKAAFVVTSTTFLEESPAMTGSYLWATRGQVFGIPRHTSIDPVK